jgi:hypothetical protein
VYFIIDVWSLLGLVVGGLDVCHVVIVAGKGDCWKTDHSDVLFMPIVILMNSTDFLYIEVALGPLSPRRSQL